MKGIEPVMNDTKKKCNKNKKNSDCEQATQAYIQKSNTDILGSYTGNPALFEKPEQDADDL